MVRSRELNVYHLLAGVVLAAGFAVRLLGLGAAPLTEGEAALALEAYSTVPGNGPGDLGLSPAYVSLTGLIFILAGDNEFTVRLIPALAGAALVMVPFLLRRRLGKFSALIMGLGLALDPVLVGLSRLADGPMLSVGALSLAVALRIADSDADGGSQAAGRVAPAILAAVAVLSGPDIYLGGLILAATWAAVRLLRWTAGDLNPGSYGRPAWTAFSITAVLAGTQFMRFPQGVGAFAASLPAFLSGWVNPGSVPAGRLLIALAAYQGLLIVFAVIATFRSRNERSAVRMLAVGLVSALVIVLLHPGRAVGDTAWVIIPLWGLAAAEIGRPERWINRNPHAGRSMLLAGVLVVLLVSFWTNLAGLSYTSPGDPQYTLRLLIMAGTLILAALSVSLVAMGWERESASTGAVWGIGILMLFGMASGIWGTSHRDALAQRELWRPSPLPGQAEILDTALLQLGGWSLSEPSSLEILLAIDSPAAQWQLRRYPGLSRGRSVSGEQLPAVVLAAEGDTGLRLSAAYRGEPLVWRVYPAWELMRPADWLKWMLFREAPVSRDAVVLWARADLFLVGGESLVDPFPFDTLDESPPPEEIPLENVEDVLPGK